MNPKGAFCMFCKPPRRLRHAGKPQIEAPSHSPQQAAAAGQAQSDTRTWDERHVDHGAKVVHIHCKGKAKYVLQGLGPVVLHKRTRTHARKSETQAARKVASHSISCSHAACGKACATCGRDAHACSRIALRHPRPAHQHAGSLCTQWSAWSAAATRIHMLAQPSRRSTPMRQGRRRPTPPPAAPRRRSP